MTRLPDDPDARHLIAAVLARDDLDDLLQADLLGIAIQLDDTYPPPPPLADIRPSAHVVPDLTRAADDLDRRTRTGGVPDRLRAAEALRELHAVIRGLTEA